MPELTNDVILAQTLRSQLAALGDTIEKLRNLSCETTLTVHTEDGQSMELSRCTGEFWARVSRVVLLEDVR